MDFVKFQMFVFIYTLFGGILIGILLDVYKAMLSRKRKVKNIFWDLCFLFVSVAVFLWILFLCTYGEIRMYMLLGITVGLFFYIRLFSKPTFLFFLQLKQKINSVFRLNLLYNICYKPWQSIRRGIRRIYHLPIQVMKDFFHYRSLIKKRGKQRSASNTKKDDQDGDSLFGETERRKRRNRGMSKKTRSTKKNGSGSRGPEPQKKKEKTKKRPIIKFLMIVICVSACVTLVKQQVFLQELKKQQAVKQQQIDGVKAENKALEKKLGSIESPEYIEEQARAQLGLVKPGEKIYIDTERQDKDTVNP